MSERVSAKVVIIDNYDSFSYNLYQYFGEAADEVFVVKNDEYTPEEIEKRFSLTHLVLSPGPCRPAEAGICEAAVLYFAGKVPVLGVCLGHQAICEAFGAKIVYAKRLMHGKADDVRLDPAVEIFRGLPETDRVARYHSLAADQLPETLRVTARASDGEIMGVKHVDHNIFGLQFHPESILTEHGREMIKNFLALGRG